MNREKRCINRDYSTVDYNSVPKCKVRRLTRTGKGRIEASEKDKFDSDLIKKSDSREKLGTELGEY